MQLEELLKQLVSFKTVTADKGEIDHCFGWMEKSLSHLPLFFEKFSSNGCASLLITTRQTRNPRLWLAGHIDVVPGAEPMFRPIVKDGNLYGRGIFDMKYAVACYLNLLLDLKEDLKNYDFGLMLTSDEETGGANGVKALLQAGYTSEVCVLPDGGSDWQLITGAKGIWQVTVKSQGKPAHSSKPWLGKSAVLPLVAFLHTFNQELNLSQPIKADDATTVNVGLLQAGTVPNQVAETATATLDIRFPSESARLRVAKVLQNLMRQTGDLSIEEEKLEQSFTIDPLNAHIQLFAKIAQQYVGRPLKTAITYGTCDARFFAMHGIPTVILRPRGGGHHTNEEWVNLQDVKTFYKILKEYVLATVAI